MRRKAVWLLVTYLVLLAVSHGLRALQRAPRHPVGPAVTVRTVVDDRLDEPAVRMAYVERGAGSPGAAPLILVHGSPGSKGDLRRLVAALPADGRRVIVPDLPGFGDSTRGLPDYSIRAHARYVLQMMDALDIPRAHLVGLSMGGGVVLNLYDLVPERVDSVTLLSAIGVQELELFGDRRLNHVVHAAQLLAIRVAQEALPHMGLLDGAFFGRSYARNFYDSDQRPLRGILERFGSPMLILHGERDFLVPHAAAIEHRRIVPQAELQMMPQGHFIFFLQADEVARRISDFVDRVDAGQAPGRDAAAPERVAAAAGPFDPSVIPPYTGAALLVMLLLIVVATLVTEDLTCIGVGLLVAQGRIEFLPGVLACCAGIFVGDMLLFAAGRWLGRPALRRAPLRWLVHAEHVDRASAWFVRRGAAVIGLSRFFPGTRLPTYFAAGVLRTGAWRFTLYFAIAVAVWTPLLVGFSMLLGERAFGYFDWFAGHALWGLLLLGLWILVVIKLLLPLLSFAGRRRLLGRLRRTAAWEFWPPWLFDPPVVAYVAWLGLKHRDPLLFTAANPGIEAGGFIAESKWRILQGLAGAGHRVARTELIPDGALERRVARAREFMESTGLCYPVVLKPDAGQRGSAVAIVRGQPQLEIYLERVRVDLLIQEYVPGREFGVFYYRLPGNERGRILSITDKRMPVVRGDGVHTLERLILADARAICMADHYLALHAGDLERVPEKGEQVRLVELGTHCRGAIFLDGRELASAPLERAIEEISRCFDGFYFGRYDLRVPDAESLSQGRDFKVIELNGVTSEATHIYDPRVGLLEAYGTLFEQWRLAFEIGRRNRERGTRPAGAGELLRLIRRYRRLARVHP